MTQRGGGGGLPTGPAGGGLGGAYPDPTVNAHATSHEPGGTDEILSAPYDVDGGRVVWDSDNGRLISGFHEPNDNVIHADWTQVTPAGTSIAKVAGTITMTIDNGTNGDWWSPNFTGPHMLMDVPTSAAWELIMGLKHDGTTNDQGCVAGIQCKDAADNVHMVYWRMYQSNLQKNYYIENSSAVRSNNDGATEGWIRMLCTGETLYLMYSNTAFAAGEPDDGDWTEWTAEDVSNIYMQEMQILLASLRTSGSGERTLDFHRPKFKLL